VETDSIEWCLMTTIKTIKLKRNPASTPSVTPPGSEESAQPQPDASSPDASVTMAAAPSGQEPVSAVSGGRRSPYTVFAILGLLAVIAVCAIIGFQASEMFFYSSSPSVWPVK
jgi:hypothetical protein